MSKPNTIGWMISVILLTSSASLFAATITGASDSPGVLMQWHKVTLTIDGPSSSEGDTPNPFLDYRMNVTFTHPGTGKTYLVPGYFAVDGNAANTSASSGNQWRAHLCPDFTGTWNYSVSFRQGTNVAVDDNTTAGMALAPYDGITGSFNVVATDKIGRDMRAKGRLTYVGKHFLQFAGNGEYFFKQGPDAPENFLAYNDFDGDFKSDGHDDHRIKSWSAHAGDWNSGDPQWQGSKGREMIGAINYLASEGLNAFSFLTMNINGDDKNVFPYTAYGERYRMDCSRLDQWEIVFEHADRMGMFLHFKTQETENELLLDSGNLGTQRKLYYRELIARFGHHLALNWNLGEEINNATTAQKVSWAQYFYDHDPYRHHIVIHNMGEPHYDLLGSSSKLTGFSLQTSNSDFSAVFTRVKDYIDRSVAAGKPWAVACDEPGDAQHALRPDWDAGNSHEDGRKNALWGTFMAGGWGNEWYFGYAHDHSDLTCQDYRSRDAFWDYCRYAVQFFSAEDEPTRKAVPAQNMSNADSRVTGTGNHCLYGVDDDGKPCLVVSTDDGGSFTLNVPAAAFYYVGWMNAKTGTRVSGGDIVNHPGGNVAFTAPDTDDWILLLYDWVDIVDNDPPTPDPAQWQTMPYPVNDTTISMTAVTGTDAVSPPVQYYFEETSGNCHAVDSGWQTSPTYEATGLAAGIQYCYTVKMRDARGNETAASSEVCVTTTGTQDTDAPSPAPDFELAPVAVSSNEVTMLATLATDASGPVEYYFEETSGNPGGSDSGWQTEREFTDTGLSGGYDYTYTVKARDAVCNETAASGPESVFTPVPQIVTLPFGPTDDAFLQSGTPYNTTQLKVEPGTRISYMKFNIAGIPAGYDVTSVTLDLTENGDPGDGTLRFHTGSHNNWTETTITSGTAPAAGAQVGSRAGAVNSGQKITVDVTPFVTGNGIVSMVIMMDSGGNDIWFGSKESGAKAPVLTVTAESSGPADMDAPTPDPAEVESTSSTNYTVTVTAAEGTDISLPVQYYFEETSGNFGADNSGWQLSRVYIDEGLSPGTEYVYTVKMRDSAGNQTVASDPVAITTTGTIDNDAPTPDPAVFSVLPKADDQSSISMTAQTGLDANGPVEYYFAETSGNPGGDDSGWQTSPSYTDTGLETGTMYTYTVTMKDILDHTTVESAPASTYTLGTPDLTGEGDIDFEDLKILCLMWLMTDCLNNDLCDGADMDVSGTVDLGDFSMIAQKWLTSLGSGQTPYNGTPGLIPGKIEAEEYDTDGEGVAYHDTSPGNSGGEFRTDDVDIGSYSGGYNLGWIADGEWVEYTVNATAGIYDLTARVATIKDGSSFNVLLDDVLVATVNVPNTGAWDAFVDVTVPGISIAGGNGQILRIEFVCPNGGHNLDWIEFSQSLAANLALHFPLDEASGTTAQDASVNNRDGSLVGMAGTEWTTGSVGNALAFDGVDDYIDVSGYTGVLGNNSRTSMAWVKTTGTGSNMVIANWGVNALGQQWLFGVYGAGEVGIFSGGVDIKTNALIADDEWHHVAAVLLDDGSPTLNEIQLYIDGVLQASTSTSSDPINTVGGNDMCVGAFEYAPGLMGFYYLGLMDDLRIYDIALTANQIASIAAEGSGPSGQTYVLDATTDFPDINAGNVPAYIDSARDALAIDAALYKDQWAAAKTTFTGVTGIYEFTVVALTETDGESSYGVKINGVPIGDGVAKQNPYEGPGGTDYVEVEHTWADIPISSGDEIEVWFNTHTNGDIPEGSGTAYSRGRWRRLILDGGGSTEPSGTYLESGGLVIMECENTETPQSQWGDWDLVTPGDSRYVSGATNSAHIEFTGNTINGGTPKNPLTYNFKINQDGIYYLHIRARKRLEGAESDKCNDCYVKMAGDFTSGNPNATLNALKTDTKLYGGNATNWGWASNLDSAEADHTAAAYNFKAGESYTLTISGRSIRFNIDRIVLRHSSITASSAQSTSNPESERVP